VTSQEPLSPDQRGLPPSALVLIAANLVPLLGVLGSSWTVFSVLLLYWCENVIVGAFNILRMLVASPKDVAADAAKLFLIPFFTFHYGMFTMVHGIFVLALFGPDGGHFSPSPAAFLGAVRGAGIGYAALAVLLSHGFSFAHNYIAGGEFRSASLPQLMMQPYARVMVLHVTILLGGFAAKAAGAPLGALILLIALKTLIDLRAHLAERRKLGTISAP
jgi:hypothetical protein